MAWEAHSCLVQTRGGRSFQITEPAAVKYLWEKMKLSGEFKSFGFLTTVASRTEGAQQVKALYTIFFEDIEFIQWFVHDDDNMIS